MEINFEPIQPWNASTGVGTGLDARTAIMLNFNRLKTAMQALESDLNLSASEKYALALQLANQIIDPKIEALKGGAAPAYDTLLEIQQALQEDDAAMSNLLTLLGQKQNRVRTSETIVADANGAPKFLNADINFVTQFSGSNYGKIVLPSNAEIGKTIIVLGFTAVTVFGTVSGENIISNETPTIQSDRIVMKSGEIYRFTLIFDNWWLAEQINGYTAGEKTKVAGALQKSTAITLTSDNNFNTLYALAEGNYVVDITGQPDYFPSILLEQVTAGHAVEFYARKYNVIRYGNTGGHRALHISTQVKTGDGGRAKSCLIVEDGTARENISAAEVASLLSGNIINNLVTGGAGKSLGAEQGPVILESLSVGFDQSGYISTSGVNQSDATRSRTGFIRISIFNDITFLAESNNQYVNAISFYDKNKAFISGIANNQINIAAQTVLAANIPTNAAYIRLSTTNALLSTSFVKFGGVQQSLAAAELRLLSEIVGKLDKKLGKNLFNKATITSGCFLGSDGSLNALASYYISDYIPVAASTQYISSNFGIGGAKCCIYDVNKGLISNFSTNGFTTPSNAAYVRMSGQLSTIDTAQVELGSTATTYEKYTEYLPLATLEASIDGKIAGKIGYQYTKNLFNYQDSGVKRGFYLGVVSGSVYEVSSASYSITGYIPVTAGLTYICNKAAGGGAQNIWFDSSKNYISSFNTASAIAPTNAAYVRFTLSVTSSADLYSAQVQVEQNTVSTSYIDYSDYLPMLTLKTDMLAAIAGKLSRQFGKNLFNKATITSGYFLNSNGNTYTNASYYVSDFIPVVASTQYITSNFGIGGAYCCIYDANKGVISAFQTNGFTTPSNAAYVRMSGQLSTIDTAQVEVGSVATYFEAYTDYLPLGNVAKQVQTQDFVTVLPSKMYFVKNKQACLYYENIIRKNFGHPTSLFCSKGVNYNRLIQFYFTAAATGQTMTMQIINALKKLEQKTITYDVIDSAVNNGKTTNILFVGDSFTDIGSYITETKSLLNAAGVTVNLIGTNGNSTFKAEGLSGGTLANTFLDATAGVAKIVAVTGITTMPTSGYPGQIYSDSNGNQWTIRGGKVDGSGNGHIRVTKFGAVNNDFNTFPSSGVLTRVSTSYGSGDATINYSTPIAAYFNPFLNHSTGVLDITNYINYWGFSNPNIVVFQFTWNDTNIWASDSSLASVVANFKAACDHVHSAYPSAKVVLSIEPYGSVNGNLDWNGKKFTVLRFVELMLAQFEADSNYNSWVRIAPSYAFVDLVYGYSSSTTIPCERYPSVTEQSGGDGVHPGTGMLQIADCLYPIIESLL